MEIICASGSACKRHSLAGILTRCLAAERGTLNVEEIRALIELFEASSLSELSLQREGSQLILKRKLDNFAPIEAQTPSRPTAPASQEPTSQPAGYEVKSPLVGTFYLRPSPEEPAYVEIGSEVKVGDTLCIVEAMKVMNEIKADCGGIIRNIAIEDGHVVEYGQALMIIDPT